MQHAVEAFTDVRRFMAPRGLDEYLLSLDKLKKKVYQIMVQISNKRYCFNVPSKAGMAIYNTAVLAYLLLVGDIAWPFH